MADHPRFWQRRDQHAGPSPCRRRPTRFDLYSVVPVDQCSWLLRVSGRGSFPRRVIRVEHRQEVLNRHFTNKTELNEPFIETGSISERTKQSKKKKKNKTNEKIKKIRPLPVIS